MGEFRKKPSVFIAVTGASGSIYALQLLRMFETIKEQVENLSVCFSETAKKVWAVELPDENWNSFSATYYQENDYFAPFASGSNSADVMIVIPATMGIIGRIGAGISDSLIARAADVVLKEQKTLILVPRETPLNQIHLNNMLQISNAGASIFPASPSFYHQPESLDALTQQFVLRLLDYSGFSVSLNRWGDE